MVQRDVQESAINIVHEERQDALEVAAPDAWLTKVKASEVATARLSKVEAPEVVAPDALQSKMEASLAPRMVSQPELQLPGKSRASSFPEAGNRTDVGSLVEALNKRYAASAAVGAQLLRSVKRKGSAEFREFLRCLGVSKRELVLTSSSMTLLLFVPLLLVGIVVLLIAMRAQWKDPVANKERDGWRDPKSRAAHASLRSASSMPQPRQATQASLPPSGRGLLASPGKPREPTPGKSPEKTPQKSATPLVQQTDWPSEKHSGTPTRGWADAPKLSLSLDQLVRGGHLCAELVVPENNECTLLLPEIIQTRFNTSGGLSIVDMHGMAVLCAAYSLAERPPAGPHDLPGNGKRLILRSALEDIVLASCKDAEPEAAGGPRQLAILNKSEEPVGIIRATNPGSYLVSLSTGKKLSIRRDVQAHSSCVSDEDGWLLACTEDADEHGRTIRVSPLVDAGLMALTVLGIDILDVIMTAHGSSDHGTSSSSHQHQQQSRTFFL